MNKTAEGINFYCYLNKAIKSFSLKQENPGLYRRFVLYDQWAWSWSADWDDFLIKQVAGKTCRIIPSCNFMANAIIFNPQPYWFITVQRPGNTCHTKQAACICLCKSWHIGKIKYLWKLKNHPETSVWNADKFLQNSMGRLLPVLYKYTSQMRAMFKPYEEKAAVAKNRRLAQANICPWSMLPFAPRFPEENSQ